MADYAAFAATVVVACGALHLWLRRTGRQPRAPWLLWLAVAATLVGGGFLTEARGNLERQRLEEMVAGFAPTYAQELSLLGHAGITPQTDPADPRYLAMIEAEIRWERVNPWIADIYTLRKLPDGRNVFIVDSETDYDRNGHYEGDREQRTAIGEVYDKELPALERAFAGQAGFADEPYTDRWGTWVSAFVPMFDQRGRIDGVLGVDYDGDAWVRAVARGRLLVIGGLSLVVFFLLSSTTVVALLRADLVERERAAAEMARLNADLERRVRERTAELAAANEGLSREVAERKAAQAAIEAARHAAEAATRAKTEFLANVSHEMRTPLHIVLGMSEILGDSPLEGEQRQQLDAIHRSTVSLLAIVEDILDLSKIEAGKLALVVRDFDLRAVVDDVEGMLGPQARQKGLTLSSSVSGRLPEILEGDPVRLRQVLTNLVGNAIKFTDRGEVRLDAAVLHEADDAVVVRLAVTDTGIGVAPERQAAVFESFTQGDGSTKRRYGGTGLGLTICSQLMELMGGRIGLTSAIGAGSTFWVEVALGRAGAKAGDAEVRSPHAAPATSTARH